MPHLPFLALGLLSLRRPSPITNTLFSGSFFRASHKPSLGFQDLVVRKYRPQGLLHPSTEHEGAERRAFMGLPPDLGWGCAHSHPGDTFHPLLQKGPGVGWPLQPEEGLQQVPGTVPAVRVPPAAPLGSTRQRVRPPPPSQPS